MKYCLNKHECRKEILLKYFGQCDTKACENECDVCQSKPCVHELDITDCVKTVGECVQKIKNEFNGKRLTIRQMANIITGKKNAEIEKKKYNELLGYGCFRDTVE